MIAFFVPGVPAPGGSKKAFVNRKTGKAILVDMGVHNKDWRRAVGLSALEARGESDVKRGALAVDFEYIMPRPKSHYGTGRNNAVLKPSAPYYHTVKPDGLKLSRSTEDALTGILWADDAQIAQETFIKHYGDTPGARVRVRALDEPGKRTYETTYELAFDPPDADRQEAWRAQTSDPKTAETIDREGSGGVEYE